MKNNKLVWVAIAIFFVIFFPVTQFEYRLVEKLDSTHKVDKLFSTIEPVLDIYRHWRGRI